MPTELEELVEFLHHGNTEIRKVAIENLVGYSKAQPALFKRYQLEPIKDLKLLVKDYAPISRHALTILINLSSDHEILKSLAEDDTFLETVLLRITNANEPTANDLATLLANLGKSPSLTRLITLKPKSAPKELSKSPLAIDQLLDLFVKGVDGGYNKHANFDDLAYLFGDLAKDEAVQRHLTTPSEYDALLPLTKLTPFTSHSSLTRRRGVATALKNTLFYNPAHAVLLSETSPLTSSSKTAGAETHVITFAAPSTGHEFLTQLLLPLAGPDEYPEHESDQLLPELQLLPASKQRESDTGIIKDLLECLLLLCSSREGRDELRKCGVYLVVRELHLAVEDDGVRENCERLVDLLMRGEEGEDSEEKGNADAGITPREQQSRVVEVDEEDELIDVA
ncbi:MAG: hypothetical protein Q9162_001814 [Coniocarpon cinnabarinum]